jgi:hypothetical protein
MRRVMSSAAWDACHRTRSRLPGNWKRSETVPDGPAMAMKTVPTGLASPPPDGPATPVTPMPNVASARPRTPSANPRATSSLTAPCISSTSGGIPANAIFDALL